MSLPRSFIGHPLCTICAAALLYTASAIFLTFYPLPLSLMRIILLTNFIINFLV
jgi:hypothetical protein